MAEQSKEVDSHVSEEPVEEVLARSGDPVEDEDSDEEEHPDASNVDTTATSSKAKKKKSKKAKIKQMLGGKTTENEVLKPASKLTPAMVEQLLVMNPSLRGEVAGMDAEKAAEALKKLKVSELLTGMSVSGKNQKDMASYKFWQTQPVPRFDDTNQDEDGPIKMIDTEKVPKQPKPMLEGFEWVTMDLNNEKELHEVYELLVGHFVEDVEAMFRLRYSSSFLNWALKSPGWRREWHIGVRATKSRKLVAFISGVPVDLRVRSKVFRTIEVNFLCVHKKLRSKRLTPVLIEEVTRQAYLLNVYQAFYTAGTILPRPVSSCRYFHRPLDWLKLFECDFSGMPHGSTKARQITKNHLPSSPALKGIRPVQKKDITVVHDLLSRYLERFAMAPKYTKEELEYWLLHDERIAPEQVVWCYVVEDPQTHKITDFVSFYCLESSVMNNPRHQSVRAAYMFYYATEAAFQNDDKALKERLNALVHDTLVLAKSLNFDVFNALTVMDNPLFLEQQKFQAGDGQLHYYLFNYRTAPIPGGVDGKNKADPNRMGGVGVAML